MNRSEDVDRVLGYLARPTPGSPVLRNIVGTPQRRMEIMRAVYLEKSCGYGLWIVLVCITMKRAEIAKPVQPSLAVLRENRFQLDRYLNEDRGSECDRADSLVERRGRPHLAGASPDGD